jgi:hypothetical protein
LNADRIGVNTSERGFVDYLTDPATYKFAIFGGRDFQQTGGIPMVINYAPLLAELFPNRLHPWAIHGKQTKARPIL